ESWGCVWLISREQQCVSYALLWGHLTVRPWVAGDDSGAASCERLDGAIEYRSYSWWCDREFDRSSTIWRSGRLFGCLYRYLSLAGLQRRRLGDQRGCGLPHHSLCV